MRTQSGLGVRFSAVCRWIVAATAVRLGQRVSGNSNLLPGMSRLTDERRIGYFGDWTESDCRGPSILNTAFLADAQESLKVTWQPHTTGRTTIWFRLLCGE